MRCSSLANTGAVGSGDGSCLAQTTRPFRSNSMVDSGVGEPLELERDFVVDDSGGERELFDTCNSQLDKTRYMSNGHVTNASKSYGLSPVPTNAKTLTNNKQIHSPTDPSTTSSLDEQMPNNNGVRVAGDGTSLGASHQIVTNSRKTARQKTDYYSVPVFIFELLALSATAFFIYWFHYEHQEDAWLSGFYCDDFSLKQAFNFDSVFLKNIVFPTEESYFFLATALGPIILVSLD